MIKITPIEEDGSFIAPVRLPDIISVEMLEKILSTIVELEVTLFGWSMYGRNIDEANLKIQ